MSRPKEKARVAILSRVTPETAKKWRAAKTRKLNTLGKVIDSRFLKTK